MYAAPSKLVVTPFCSAPQIFKKGTKIVVNNYWMMISPTPQEYHDHTVFVVHELPLPQWWDMFICKVKFVNCDMLTSQEYMYMQSYHVMCFSTDIHAEQPHTPPAPWSLLKSYFCMCVGNEYQVTCETHASQHVWKEQGWVARATEDLCLWLLCIGTDSVQSQFSSLSASSRAGSQWRLWRTSNDILHMRVGNKKCRENFLLTLQCVCVVCGILLTITGSYGVRIPVDGKEGKGRDLKWGWEKHLIYMYNVCTDLYYRQYVFGE